MEAGLGTQALGSLRRQAGVQLDLGVVGRRKELRRRAPEPVGGERGQGEGHEGRRREPRVYGPGKPSEEGRGSRAGTTRTRFSPCGLRLHRRGRDATTPPNARQARLDRRPVGTPPPSPVTVASPAARLPLVAVAFFLSGAAALVYQVVWQRILELSSGIGIYSVAMIVGAFMAGLGLGATWAAWSTRLQPDRALWAFAAIEVGVAVFGASSCALFYDLLYQRVGWLYSVPGAPVCCTSSRSCSRPC